MSTLATKCNVQSGDSLATVVEKVKAHVDAVLPGEPLHYRADQTLMAFDGIVVIDKIATINAAHAAFVQHYGEGAPEALARQRQRFDA